MIGVVGSARPLFHELLWLSLRDMRARLEPDVEFYVVVLLDDFGQRPYSEEPLGPKLLAGSCPNRALVLRDVGDRSLILAGFLEERARRRGLTTSYLSGLASAAYGELSSGHLEPFRTMSSSVDLLVGALRGVREHCDAMGMDAWSAYERWLRARSPALERRLVQLGLPITGGEA